MKLWLTFAPLTLRGKLLRAIFLLAFFGFTYNVCGIWMHYYWRWHMSMFVPDWYISVVGGRFIMYMFIFYGIGIGTFPKFFRGQNGDLIVCWV